MRRCIAVQDVELPGLPEAGQNLVLSPDVGAAHARGCDGTEFQNSLSGFEIEFPMYVVAGGKAVHFLCQAVEVQEAWIFQCRYSLAFGLADLPAPVH